MKRETPEEIAARVIESTCAMFQPIGSTHTLEAAIAEAIRSERETQKMHSFSLAQTSTLGWGCVSFSTSAE